MRVGANARQFARIKRLHKAGTPPPIIAKTIQMTEQSLEKILAHIDGREEVILAVEENEEVQSLRLANAELLAKLAKFEAPDSKEPGEESPDDDALPEEKTETVEETEETETE